MNRLIIFDFDGVVADSETLANTALAETITELGAPTSLDDAFRLYMGKRFADVIDAIEVALGHSLPTDFPDDLQARTLARFRKELRATDGVYDYIHAFAHVNRCIASSSSPHRLAVCLEALQLQQTFGPHVFSASSVARGKPHPDIFLHAADRMGVDASNAIVIEDSPSGVQAGVAAGMTVIGLLAASHIRDGHEERLRRAGAHFVARTFAQAESITRDLLSDGPDPNALA